MKARIIAIEACMRIDRKKGCKYLGDEKEKKWFVEKCFLNKKVLTNNHSGYPSGSYYCCHSIDKQHFGKFEQFGHFNCPNKWGGNEQKMEKIQKGFFKKSIEVHECIVN